MVHVKSMTSHAGRPDQNNFLCHNCPITLLYTEHTIHSMKRILEIAYVLRTVPTYVRHEIDTKSSATGCS